MEWNETRLETRDETVKRVNQTEVCTKKLKNIENMTTKREV